MSTNTEFFTKRPVLKYIIDGLLRRVELAIVTLGMLIYQQWHVRHQIWTEAGPHLQDVVKHEQALEVRVDGHVVTNLDSQEKETNK